MPSNENVQSETSRKAPAGYTGREIIRSGGGGVVYYTPRPVDGSFRAIAYLGSDSTPAWHCRFRTAKALVTKIEQLRASLHERGERMARLREARDRPHTLVAGDVLRALSGVGHTDVSYYQVTRANARTVGLRPIRAQRAATGSGHGDCVPMPGHFAGDETAHVVDRDNRVLIDARRIASRVTPITIGGVKFYPVDHWCTA